MLIAQLSDLHVRPKGQLYKGVVDSNSMLNDAIGHLNNLVQRPDLVILSGDLVDEGQKEEYSMLVELLNALTIPFIVAPGNHDSRKNFREAFCNHAYLPELGPIHYCVDSYPVRLIVLDSCVPGFHHGYIDEDGIKWLAAKLAAEPSKATVIVMHHPPFQSGIVALDEYRLLNSMQLEQIIRAHSNIEAILCGHVHRSMAKRWAGTVAISCPSTTTEISLTLIADGVPHSRIGPPACLLHLWRAKHGLVSHISHIGEFEGPFEFY